MTMAEALAARSHANSSSSNSGRTGGGRSRRRSAGQQQPSSGRPDSREAHARMLARATMTGSESDSSDGGNSGAGGGATETPDQRMLRRAMMTGSDSDSDGGDGGDGRGAKGGGAGAVPWRQRTTASATPAAYGSESESDSDSDSHTDQRRQAPTRQGKGGGKAKAKGGRLAKSRRSKNAPAEVSSKRPVSRFRTVIEGGTKKFRGTSPLHVFVFSNRRCTTSAGVFGRCLTNVVPLRCFWLCTDPRFDDFSGRLNMDIWEKQYKFIGDYKVQPCSAPLKPNTATRKCQLVTPSRWLVFSLPNRKAKKQRHASCHAAQMTQRHVQNKRSGYGDCSKSALCTVATKPHGKLASCIAAR